MQLPIELPDFITPLMKQWLIQYQLDELKDCTHLGLFHWDYFPNRRQPTKPRRIPKIDLNITLIDSNFKRSTYFLQLDANTLHVFEASGMSLAGLRIGKEYILVGEQFVKTRTLMKMIS